MWNKCCLRWQKISAHPELNAVGFSQNFMMINNRKLSGSAAKSAIAVIIFGIRVRIQI
jgi:hypothetical protein